MKPIYKPKGAAAEYGDYAVNIYTGCPHRCYYCFAPQVLHREREVFHSCVEPRKDIVRELRRQLEWEQITGKLVHLCFTCDPYTGRAYGKSKQVARCGNAVCPPMAEAVVRANLPEWCGKKLRTMEELERAVSA